MRRRSFLRVAASVVPAAGLQEMLTRELFAQSAASPSTALHVLGAGEDRLGHTVALPFSPSLAFKVVGDETGGGLFLIEHNHLLPGGPPLHLHLNQEEWFYVMEGEVALQVGEQRVKLHAGESVLAPRRIPHTFSSVGPSPARMLIAFCPAGKMEQYFRGVEKDPKAAGDAEFVRRCEMELVGPSPFWKS